MKHPMLTYWDQAFEYYRAEENRFYSDKMPDPILSPNFILESPSQEQLNSLPYFNVISKEYSFEPPIYENYHLRNHHFLCQLSMNPQPFESCMSMDSLEISQPCLTHQELLLDAFPEDFEFLKQLEKFLLTLNAKYFVGTLWSKEKQAVGSITFGVTGNVAILLSGMIHSNYRNQKLSRKLKHLIHAMGYRLNVKNTFYWTKSVKLTRYADKIGMYCVYVK